MFTLEIDDEAVGIEDFVAVIFFGRHVRNSIKKF
jgi:hypothetical protein